MRALAEFATDLGWALVGSDVERTAVEAWAAQNSIRLTDGLPNSNDSVADVEIRSAAIESPQPQLIATDGLERRVLSYTYPEALAELSAATSTIAVAGTHGKTTTSVLLALALGESSRIVGGVGKHDDRSGRYSETNPAPVVIEACEYRRHFLALRPAGAVLLNCEWDHPDAYRSEADLELAFSDFAQRAASNGKLVVPRHLIERLSLNGVESSSNVVSFAATPNEGYWADEVRREHEGVAFRFMKEHRCLAPLCVPALPKFQVENAVAAAAMAHEWGVTPSQIGDRLRGYRGVERRFDVFAENQAVFVDDYAHHPTAIRQTLAEVRERWPDRTLVAVFEPHQYGRLRSFEREFASSLLSADEIALAPVFLAREASCPSNALDRLAALLGDKVTRCDALDQVAQWLETRLLKQQKLVVALFGAGKIGRILDGRRERHSLGAVS